MTSRKSVQLLPDRVPSASFLEVAKDIGDSRTRRKSFARKITPWAAGAKEIKNGVDRFAHIGFARTPTGFGGRDQWFETRPFAIRHIARITPLDPLANLAALLRPYSESSSDASQISGIMQPARAGGTGMSMLAVVGVLFGIILGQFFKFFVLIPASGLAAFLVLTNPMQTDSVWGWCIQFAAATTSLQIGYGDWISRSQLLSRT
jgi:hypothetical protein